MTNGRKTVEIESQVVGKAPGQGVQPSGTSFLPPLQQQQQQQL